MRSIPNPIYHPGRIAVLEDGFDPEEFRAMISTHPTSEHVRWWKAIPSYDMNPLVGLGDTYGADRWTRIEQSGIDGYFALIQGQRAMRRYLPQGALEQGDIVVTTMPDELPFGEHDWIMPIGKYGEGARSFLRLEVVVRGGYKQNPAGTISSSGSSVSGNGTSFLDTFRAGDIIEAAGQAFRIESVSNNDSLSIDGTPSPAWAGVVYHKLIDRTLYSPISTIESIYRGSSTYRPGVDYVVGEDMQSIQWLSADQSPAPGQRYGIRYRYYAKYVVQGDMGLQRHIVAGVKLPQVVVARLWKPETHHV